MSSRGTFAGRGRPSGFSFYDSYVCTVVAGMCCSLADHLPHACVRTAAIERTHRFSSLAQHSPLFFSIAVLAVWTSHSLRHPRSLLSMAPAAISAAVLAALLSLLARPAAALTSTATTSAATSTTTTDHGSHMPKGTAASSSPKAPEIPLSLQYLERVSLTRPVALRCSATELTSLSCSTMRASVSPHTSIVRSCS